MILEITLRMLLALGLGFAIGFERKMRFKEAGIRTHTIVCVGACLYMIISKYGFDGADTARVAAQIVSGIGFIGAGMIFYHKEVVHGLTTAAGIWATAAIGMAAGAGMYWVSAIASALIILIQCIMHLKFRLFRSRRVVKVNISFKDPTGDNAAEIKELFGVERFSKISGRKEGEDVVYSGVINTDRLIGIREIHELLTQKPFVLSASLADDDSF
ncbi:MAG: MgtC/SapB family protein [Clostridia bacterium]|nr:MgtC/SapB family protein [Clostridia bacterium]MBQ8657749.1 MgtC/SapB family protein [Clostridia bacterium]